MVYIRLHVIAYREEGIQKHVPVLVPLHDYRNVCMKLSVYISLGITFALTKNIHV